MTGAEMVIRTARAEVGYIEKKTNAQLDSKTANAGANNYTKYARDMYAMGDVFNGNKQGFDWCGTSGTAFYLMTFGKEMGMKLLCMPEKSLAAGVKYAANYFKQAGRFYTSDPQPGDRIFFYGVRNGKVDKTIWQHTGMVSDVKNGKVYTIEGNAGPNSTQVIETSYTLGAAKIAGYGRPDWSLLDNWHPAGWTGYVISTGGEGLNCRTYPAAGNVLKAFPEGTALYIIQELNGWGLTLNEGWVSLDYVSKTAPAPTPAPTPAPEPKPEDGAADYAKASCAKAVAKSVFQGDGTGDYHWTSSITRQDLCVVLDRLGLLD